VTGATGATGATGPSGATGPTGAANFALLSNAADATVTTILGGLPGTIAILPISGFVATAATAPAVPAFGLTQDYNSQTLPSAVSLSSMRATMVLKNALALVGTTITLQAQLYKGTVGGIYTAVGTPCVFAPALTGIVSIGLNATCTGDLTGLTIAPGEVGFIAVQASAAGLTLINTVQIAASVTIE
jgi:hypothetical protein